MIFYSCSYCPVVGDSEGGICPSIRSISCIRGCRCEATNGIIRVLSIMQDPSPPSPRLEAHQSSVTFRIVVTGIQPRRSFSSSSSMVNDSDSPHLTRSLTWRFHMSDRQAGLRIVDSSSIASVGRIWLGTLFSGGILIRFFL